MTELSITIEGLDHLIQQLDSFGAELAGPLKRRALRQAALLVEADAKVLAPKVSGTLARSIHTEVTDEEARIGTDVVYARRIEYGFVGADSLGRVYNQAPQPYLRPALHSNANQILGVLAHELQQALRSLS